MVPSLKTIPLPQIDRTERPDFPIRRFNMRFATHHLDTVMWAMRLGLRDQRGLLSDYVWDFVHRGQGKTLRSRQGRSCPVTSELIKPDHAYHRLAVAWGLSYPKTDIGNVTRPGQIENIEPREIHDWQAGLISQDMV